MQSIWENDTKFKSFNPLQRDIKTDVLIVGGGIAGILLAYELQNAGIDYALVEANHICSGVTAHTTAKITSQHGLIYNKLEKEFDTNYAYKYLRANEEALEKYRILAQKYECDFDDKDNYVYSKCDYSLIENELKTLDKITDIASASDDLPIPIENVGAVRFSKQAQFNPLKLLSQLSGDLNIFENTRILSIDNNTAYTEKYKITADNIVITTHFPIVKMHGAYYLKMYQSRSYVIALDNGSQIDGMYVDEADEGMSFRNYGNCLLIGGEGHRTGKKSLGWKSLESFANKHYPSCEIKYRWAAQDCMTLDSSPYIGRYSKKTNNLYVATGFNKWGMTSSMVSASILSDLIQQRKNEYTEIFSPSRTIIRPQLALNAIESAFNLCTPTVPRCTHLGCALKWNEYEHSWDCPCHGSRYDEKGAVINTPATKPLKKEQP